MALGRQRTITRVAGALMGAAALVVAGASMVLAADHEVSMSGSAFVPANVSVAAGDTVTWTNSDARGHTATALDGSWDTGTLGNGASATVTFATAGTLPYRCEIHPDMTGTITVQAAAGGGGDATTPPTDARPATAPADGPVAAIVLLIAFGLGGAALMRRLAQPS